MPDRFTTEQRSRIMSRIKGQNTTPEKVVAQMLCKMRYRFSKCDKTLPGKPDFVLVRHKKLIFVHGCFWHGHKRCSRSGRPKTNAEFWNRKIDSNIKRDARVLRQLKRLGWTALVIWQCQLSRPERLAASLRAFLRSPRKPQLPKPHGTP